MEFGSSPRPSNPSHRPEIAPEPLCEPSRPESVTAARPNRLPYGIRIIPRGVRTESVRNAKH